MQFSSALIAAVMATLVAANPTPTTTTTAPNSYPTCPSDGLKCHQPFYLKCKNINGFYGYVQSQNDGQIFCGANNGISGCGSDTKPYFVLLSNGAILDSRGRTGEVDPNAGQFQFGYGISFNPASYVFGINSCSKPSLSYKGSTTFYACGQNTARIYPGSQVPTGDPAANGCQPFNLEVEYIV